MIFCILMKQLLYLGSSDINAFPTCWYQLHNLSATSHLCLPYHGLEFHLKNKLFHLYSQRGMKLKQHFLSHFRFHRNFSVENQSHTSHSAISIQWCQNFCSSSLGFLPHFHIDSILMCLPGMNAERQKLHQCQNGV